jgi:hypothetical protein
VRLRDREREREIERHRKRETDRQTESFFGTEILSSDFFAAVESQVLVLQLLEGLVFDEHVLR